MAAMGMLSSQLKGAHGLTALNFGPRKVAASSELRACQLRSRGHSLPPLGIANLRERDRFIPRHHGFPHGRGNIKPVAATGATEGGETGTSDEKRAKETRKNLESRSSQVRSKIYGFFKEKSGYSWLLGTGVITAAIVIPSTLVDLVSLFQNNFLAGLAATFGLDILFVLAADLFLVLADKLGQHQKVDGGSPPWIGPWEYTGYPEGYPKLLNTVSYGSVGVGILAILLSLVTGKLAGALATFGPYLGLIFAQVAYERLVGNDRLPVFPLVPILYTVYRFHQLTRGLALLPFIADGSGILTRCIHISSFLWALYLGMYLTQLPWLYSTWNSNRAT